MAGVLSMFRQFLRDPGVASVCSTAPYVVKKICARLDLSGPRIVVELGPGLGCFTRELLCRLSPDSQLIPIEKNPHFASVLSEIADPRLHVVHGNADDVRKILRGKKADLILSGIPFSHFDESRTSALLWDIRHVLAEGGRFVAYQCSSMLRRPLCRLFRQVSVERHVFHLPPLVVLEARAG